MPGQGRSTAAMAQRAGGGGGRAGGCDSEPAPAAAALEADLVRLRREGEAACQLLASLGRRHGPLA
jgi:hypothetical protein